MDNNVMPRRLLLTVEVLSPSTRRADRVKKRIVYLEEGVPEYWIVDLDARLIERWRQGDERPEIVSESIAWLPVADVPALTLDLPRFFAEILD
jgi:Uma2 family endonuclease